MIFLRANTELYQTFEKLMQTAKIPVQWNGVFAVLDNYIILQGRVRSLFFHFDSKRVTTNIIELPETVTVQEVGENVRVQNAINMVLYAFGKWGTIKGIRVEKDYAQLCELFSDIMQEYEVEPEFTPLSMRFYKNGIRVTYEDVIQMALEYDEEEQKEAEESGQGLWHKIIWKKSCADFKRVDTTLKERRRSRLGNNFYMVGYLCPLCGRKLHMVVYPEGKEFRIETEEGTVLLARAVTCERCQCFFTPRPNRLLAEGDIYVMEFGEDTAAYEDYRELLGRDGERVSNYHCNRFADGRPLPEEEEAENLEVLYANLPELSSEELHKIEARMEEGFYPDESVDRLENAVKEEELSRQEKAEVLQASGKESRKAQGDAYGKAAVRERENGQKTKQSRKYAREQKMGLENEIQKERDKDKEQGASQSRKYARAQEKEQVKEQMYCDDVLLSPAERSEVRKKYDARLNVLERYSERQLRELKSQLQRENKLLPEEREAYLARVDFKLAGEQLERLSQKAAACEGKNCAVIKKVTEEVERAEIPEKEKKRLLEQLNDFHHVQAKKEVVQLFDKMPQNLNRSQYQQYVQRIREYGDVDLTPYEAQLNEHRKAAEKQELVNVIRHARKRSREDLTALRDKLVEGDFLPELVQPYLEKVDARIRELDAAAIAQICPNPMQMTFDEAMDAYEQIEQGDFLPELKKDTLKVLKKRLARIKTDECELLVHKLKEELKDAGIVDEPKHHFYPAKKVMLKEAEPEETAVIDYAMASYAAGKGMFEYPILVVDATRSGTGREGIIITPEHLYYSTLFSAYGVKIDTIARIGCSNGLLNRGLYMYQKNGTRTKLPYAVESKKLEAFAGVLDSFIQYLQEKPDSRSLAYLASETHETICCFRCGYEYIGGEACPKCGYRNNA